MSDVAPQYEYTVYPEHVDSLTPTLQKVLALLASAYDCSVQYRVTDAGKGVVLRPVASATNPRIDLLKLRRSFQRVASNVVIAPTPCDFGSWAVLFSTTIDGVQLSVNLHLLPD